MPRIEAEHMTMDQALEADAEYLRQMTGEDHGPFESVEEYLGMPDLPDTHAAAAAAIRERIDLTNDTRPPGRMANQTWRILEEQRQAAEDTIRECDAEIERWTNKMVDAMKTKGMCEAGQRALEGGL